MLIQINRNPDNWGSIDNVWIDPDQIESIVAPNEKQQSTRVTMKSGDTITFARWPDDVARAIQQRCAEGVRLLTFGDADRTTSTALLREVLEAVCVRDGLSLDSEVEPGTPARNYELALRLGIAPVFGIPNEETR